MNSWVGLYNKIERLLPTPIICIAWVWCFWGCRVITDVLVSEFCAAVKIGSLLYITPSAYMHACYMNGGCWRMYALMFICIYAWLYATSQILLYKFSLSYRSVTSIFQFPFLVQILFISFTMQLCFVRKGGISEWAGRAEYDPVYSCYTVAFRFTSYF